MERESAVGNGSPAGEDKFAIRLREHGIVAPGEGFHLYRLPKLGVVMSQALRSIKGDLHYRVSRFFWSACLLLVFALPAKAERYSTEDESRFRDQPYEKAEPGMMAPADYITTAKAALHKRYAQFDSTTYEAPIVTRRFYRDAPVPDRDIVCVKFVYKELIKTPMSAYKRLPNPVGLVRPALLVLLRKDRSKAYVNEVYYQIW
jgi:hypothetical protein